MEKCLIIRDQTTTVKRFNLRGRKIEFKIKPVPGKENPVSWFKSAIREIVEYTTSGLQPGDKVGIDFCDTKNFERGPGWLHFQEASRLKMDDIWEMISKIYQSNSTGLSTDTFCLGVTSVQMPKGSGRPNNYSSFEEESAKRRGIVNISNKDNLCLPRALVVARAHVDKDPQYRHIRKDVKKKQSIQARQLMENSGVEIPKDGAGIPEIELFQKYLPDYQIVIYQFGTRGRDVIYEGPEARKKLNLLFHKNHFNAITSLTAAFGTNYYCGKCHVPFNNRSVHRCSGTCPCCQQSPACPRTVEILCDRCNRKFRGPVCFENHSLNICEKVLRCQKCLKTIRADRPHTCGEMFCKNCLKHQSQPHYCHIKPDNRRPKTKDTLFIFYDLETRQEEKYGEDQLHVPNLCVFNQRCDKCIAETDLYYCQKCGFRQQVLTTDVIVKFMHHLLEAKKKFKQVIVIAHNGRAFDHQFILRYILEETDLKPELIMRGTKIILMQLGNLKFIDSLNYFPMALRALPKAFGLPDYKFKKGYFPHLFNTLENQNYTGPLPSVEFYEAASMKPEHRNEFLKWYEEHKDDHFEMQRDLVDYCISDVQILTEACIKFRDMMLTACSVCPFIESTTIAGTSNLIFRRNFLKPDTIGIIPKNGYRMRDNQSPIALKWLMWEEDQRKIKISHAGNGREALVGGVLVDGYCEETNQIFEFHGCFYHGHPLCQKPRRGEALHGDPLDTLEKRFETTQDKTERLRQLGYEVVEKWMCEFLNEMKTNKEMSYLNTDPVLSTLPLNPRDAFFGGRTGNTRKYYSCKTGEKIKYIDVCSLYPWVCKNGKFPIGHPKLYVGHEESSKVDLNQTSGLIKCRILPPRNLYHPVLPVKMNDKLMFVLCQSCGHELNQGLCSHDESGRALTGTWVIEEVVKALEKGYRLLEIHEIWSYTIVQLDAETDGLFADMMNAFLKIKQEASGWPVDCTTPSQKEAYINNFLAIENIQLEHSKIVKNPGLRTLAKLILNSFWGKFGQRENQPRTSVVNKPSEFYEILSDPAVNVNHILAINENTLVVSWVYKEEIVTTLATVNVCIAAFTTAQARLKLYSYLEKLEDRVLYYDTDSIIYVSTCEGEYEPPTGEYIGDMTNELEEFGPDAYITEFVCGGPKSYLFKVFPTPDDRSDTVCKIKGIQLNHKNSQLISYESMKELILSEDPEEFILIRDTNIRRTAEHHVVTRLEEKVYKPTSNKRKFVEDNSYPYGYKKLCQ